MALFQVNISRNFKGGEFYSEFEVQNKKELSSSLKNSWKKTGLTNETGECFLIAKISYKGQEISLMIGDYVFYDDGEFLGKSYSGFDEADDEKWELIGYKDKSDYLDDDERFENKVKHIFKICKAN